MGKEYHFQDARQCGIVDVVDPAKYGAAGANLNNKMPQALSIPDPGALISK